MLRRTRVETKKTLFSRRTTTKKITVKNRIRYLPDAEFRMNSHRLHSFEGLD
jgi:hypothetical protein